MKYVRVDGNLIDVLGNEARKMKKDGSSGIVFLGENQMTNEAGEIVSYGIVTDTEKFSNFLNHPNVTVFENKEKANNDIDLMYDDFVILTSVESLALDIQLSGNPKITGYNPSKPLKNKDNLRALKLAGMEGVSNNRKAKHFE